MQQLRVLGHEPGVCGHAAEGCRPRPALEVIHPVVRQSFWPSLSVLQAAIWPPELPRPWLPRLPAFKVVLLLRFAAGV